MVLTMDATATLREIGSATTRDRLLIAASRGEVEMPDSPDKIAVLLDVSRLLAGLGSAHRAGESPQPVAERARVAVTKAIREAIHRIERHSPSLGHHLRRAIRTGSSFGYEPPEGQPASWTF